MGRDAERARSAERAEDKRSVQRVDRLSAQRQYRRRECVRGGSCGKQLRQRFSPYPVSCATAYIWHWVWVYRVSSAIRGYKGGSGLSPAVHLVLYILLPFYYIYWFYRHGHDIFIEEEKNGIGSKDVNTAMLICGVVSPVIGSVILQNRLNAVAVAKSERAEEGVSLEASIA